MDRVTLDSWFRRFAVAGISPERSGSVEPPAPLDRDAWFRKMAATGVSSRNVPKLIPAEITGTSRTRYSEWFVKESRKRHAKLRTRRFDLAGDPPVVAVILDATHFRKQGKQREAAAERAGKVKDENTWTMTIVVGVRADGSKIALAAGVTPGEHHEPIHSLLADVVERGVDRRALFVADQGGGIRKAVKQLTRSENPRLQICTTHASGIVKNKVPEESRDEVAKRLYWAWKQDDPDAALERLEEQARELEADFPEAARSVRRFAEGSVTVQRLGLTGAIRESLRSTNSQEGTNALVKLSGSMPNVAWWKDQEMLERWVAWQLIEFEETKWTRVPEPEQLVRMAERIFPELDGAEEIRAQLPPTMSIAKLPVSFEHDEQMLEIATRWLADNPGAAWHGSPHTLAALGLDPEGEVTPAALLEAMRCQDPARADEGPGERRLRTTKQISFPTHDVNGDLVEVLVDGIVDAQWELKAPPALMDIWQKGGRDAEEAERRLLDAVPAAAERATLTTTPHHGFAGIVALRRPSAAEPDRSLSVVGITFAVQRGRDARLESPASKEMLRSKAARDAEDAAGAVLDEMLRSAPRRAREGAGPRPELLAAVEARALELLPGSVPVADEELSERAAGLAASAEDLTAVAGEVGEWWEDSWQAAAQQIAAERLRTHPAARPRGDSWWPLTRGQRLALGEANSERLLGAAAMLEGLAAADPEIAREIVAAREDPLADLREPVRRVETAATAIAAERERRRRELFEEAKDGTAESPPPKLRDSRGVPVAAPIDRLRSILGPRRADALARYAHALEGKVGELDDAALGRLVAETSSAWGELDPSAALHLVAGERDRDKDFTDRLGLLRDLGREAATEALAEQAGDGSLAVESHDRAVAGRAEADRRRRELRELDAELAQRRQAIGSPESLLRNHFEVAIHHAAHLELARRERQLSRPGATAAAPTARTETAAPRPPGLPAAPLRDSLGANLGALGGEAALWIRARAERVEPELRLDRASDEQLLEELPARDPFESLPRGPRDREALLGWWRQNQDDVVRTVVIEGQLIDRARRGYAALAERESVRRGVPTPNPLAAVREARGEEFAAKVERHAAVLAGGLDSMPEQDRQARTAALRAEIDRDGLGQARFGAIAQAVALQHFRNVGNEQEAAERLRDPSPAVAPAAPEVGAAMG